MDAKNNLLMLTNKNENETSMESHNQSETDNLISPHSDKKRLNPWEDESARKRFSSIKEDRVQESTNSPFHNNKTQQYVTETKMKSENTILGSKNELKSFYMQTSESIEEVLNHIFTPIKSQISTKCIDIPVYSAKKMEDIIKQIICERLKRLMMEEDIQNRREILAAYRNIFPLETDQHMLQAAFTTLQSNRTYIEADCPDEFLKLNLEEILKMKLTEIFAKLEAMYAESRDPFNGAGQSTEVTSDRNNSSTDKVAKTVNINKPSGGNLSMLTLEKHNIILENLLKTMMPSLIKIINLDHTHESEIAKLILKSDSLKAPDLNKGTECVTSNNIDTVPGNNKEGTKEVTKNSSTGGKLLIVPTLHYAKVIGRPTLPIKEAMQKFLEQFKPKCIKRHKKQQNLLFVGFTEMANLEQILAKTGVIIRQCVIDIVASEPTRDKAIEKSTNNDVKNKTDTLSCEDMKLQPVASNMPFDISSQPSPSEGNSELNSLTIGSECKDLSQSSLDVNHTPQNPKVSMGHANIIKTDQVIESRSGAEFEMCIVPNEQINDPCIRQESQGTSTIATKEIPNESVIPNKNDITQENNNKSSSQCIVESIEGKTSDSFPEVVPEGMKQALDMELPGPNRNQKQETISKRVEIYKNTIDDETNKCDDEVKGIAEENVIENVRMTRSRATSRLANVTPSKVTTRRTSKMLQE